MASNLAATLTIALLENGGDNGTHTGAGSQDTPVKSIMCRQSSRELMIAFGWISLLVSFAGVFEVLLKAFLKNNHNEYKWYFVTFSFSVAVVADVLAGLNVHCAQGGVDKVFLINNLLVTIVAGKLGTLAIILDDRLAKRAHKKAQAGARLGVGTNDHATRETAGGRFGHDENMELSDLTPQNPIATPAGSVAPSASQTSTR
ncbi:hypothetical protein Slin15195_G048290 [Septoria linicola]|uniref:Uncharacterized protein n=1 Tax=Septoria linicola TaxID=215465 RepID=A0A9Q9EI00_9PEZI|nr:hypothetical protein Slin15195_G048290 [Septoria linicola]